MASAKRHRFSKIPASRAPIKQVSSASQHAHIDGAEGARLA